MPAARMAGWRGVLAHPSPGGAWRVLAAPAAGPPATVPNPRPRRQEYVPVCRRSVAKPGPDGSVHRAALAPHPDPGGPLLPGAAHEPGHRGLRPRHATDRAGRHLARFPGADARPLLREDLEHERGPKRGLTDRRLQPDRSL